MRAFIGPAAAVIAVAIAAPAGAATWSPPQTLSSSHLFVDGLGLAVSRDGRALATWRFSDPAGHATRSGASSASRPPGADAFGPERALVPTAGADRRGQLVEGVAAYGRDRLLLATTRAVGAARGRIAIDVRAGRTDGTLGTRRTIRGAGTARRPSHVAEVALAVNARGGAVLAWFEDRGTRSDRVYVSLRRPGGRFGAPRRLATGRVRGVAAAVGLSGDVLVAWDNLGVLRTRFKPRRRDGFRATERIRSRPAFFAQMRPVVTANGRAVLAWSAQFASEGGEPGDAFFQAAVRPASAERFRRAVLLERLPAGDASVGRPIDAVDDSTGDVVIAWSGHDGSNRRVRAARVEQSGDVGPGSELSPPGREGLLSDLAAGPDGQLIAVWDGGIDDPASTVGAAVSPAADQPFGPPELVSPAGQDARFGAAAFDPATGRPTVLFANRPGGSGGTIDQIRTYAEASTRSE